jgi:hypothetical protein
MIRKLPSGKYRLYSRKKTRKQESEETWVLSIQEKKLRSTKKQCNFLSIDIKKCAGLVHTCLITSFSSSVIFSVCVGFNNPASSFSVVLSNFLTLK